METVLNSPSDDSRGRARGLTVSFFDGLPEPAAFLDVRRLRLDGMIMISGGSSYEEYAGGRR